MVPRTLSENINITNTQELYIIPQKRPYVIPQKRTELEQRIMDMMNFGKYLKNKEN